MTLEAALAYPQGELTTVATAAIANKWRENTSRRIAAKLHESGNTKLADQLENHPTPARAWQPALGLAVDALTQGKAPLAALQLCVSGDTTPVPSTIQAHIGEKSRLFVDGWSVDLLGDTEIKFDDRAMTIESTLGCTRFQRNGQRLQPFESTVKHPSTNTAAGFRYVVPQATTAVTGQFPWPPHNSPKKQFGPARQARFQATLQSALSLLASTGHNSETWVTETIDGCLNIAGPRSLGVSSPKLPGLIALGPQTSVLKCFAELVAQASQQHLFQLLLMSDLIQSGTEEIHYLPTRRVYLTTRRLLAHAHEHANVAIALRAIPAKSEYREDVESTLDHRLMAFHVECAPGLEKSQTLSASGRNLWNALRTQIAAN